MAGGGELSNDNHLLDIREERREKEKNRDDINEVKIKGLLRDLDTTDRNLILCAKITGAWTNVWGTTVTGKVLLATEFCDFLCAHYNVPPSNPHRKRNGCGTSFNIYHTLSWCKGGLVIARHNKMREKILYLAWQSFTSEAVRAEPLIYKVRNRSEREIRQGSDKLETRGDVMIWGLCYQHTDAIINVKLGDVGTDSYIF